MSHMLRPVEPSVVMVGGIHGAGKSTLCCELQSELNTPHVTTQTVMDMSSEPLSRQQAHRRVLEIVRAHLQERRSFVFEHVMSGHFVDKLLAMARASGFSTHLVYIDVGSADVAYSRVEQRVLSGGHHRSQEEVALRLDESRANFWLKYRVIADSWVLFDNTAETRREIARSAAGGGIEIFSQSGLDSFCRRLPREERLRHQTDSAPESVAGPSTSQ